MHLEFRLFLKKLKPSGKRLNTLRESCILLKVLAIYVEAPETAETSGNGLTILETVGHLCEG